MTSGTGPNKKDAKGAKNAPGFTLLEICFVLFIVALVFGAAVPALSGWLAEQRLRGPAAQLELLARTARLTAIERQRPYEVVLQRGVLLLAEAEAESSSDRKETDAPAAALPDPYYFSEGITVLTQPWGEDEFANRPETRWLFLPSGLCEPFRVKFLRDGSEIDLAFDPLTATVSDESYAFR